MTAYRCRVDYCQSWLFDSDAACGRVQVTCRKCRTAQLVFLGGRMTRDEVERLQALEV